MTQNKYPNKPAFSHLQQAGLWFHGILQTKKCSLEDPAERATFPSRESASYLHHEMIQPSVTEMGGWNRVLNQAEKLEQPQCNEPKQIQGCIISDVLLWHSPILQYSVLNYKGRGEKKRIKKKTQPHPSWRSSSTLPPPEFIRFPEAYKVGEEGYPWKAPMNYRSLYDLLLFKSSPQQLCPGIPNDTWK